MTAALASLALLFILVPLSWRAGDEPAPPPAPSTFSPSSAEPSPLTPPVARLAERAPNRQIEVIVQFKPEVAPAAGSEIVKSSGGKVFAEIDLIRGLAVRLSAAEAAELASRPGVRAVSLNASVESHDLDIRPRELATSFNQSVRSPQVWDGGKFQATGRGVGVAVIDTGIQGDLPDFQRDDGTSRVIASATTTPEGTHGDGYGHGTHVAGLIAGNGEHRDGTLQGKYAGTAPEANLISVKVADDQGEATLLDVIYGLQFIIDHKDRYGIRVANLSLNSTVAESYRTDPLDAAVEEAWFAGIVIVAAAGNRGTDADAVHYAPGNDPFVISVGAVDDKGTKVVTDDSLAPWSSRGQTQDGFSKPDVLAPGSHIVSTLPANSVIAQECPSCLRGGRYFQMGGTSMAAGVASGVIALLLEEHPDWTPDEVKGALENKMRDVPGAGGETAADKAIKAGERARRANEGLEPSTLIDPATGLIDFDRVRWSRVRWSESGSATGGATWSDASFSRVRWSGEETADGADTDVDPDRVRWSRVRWSMSFSK
jgi:serine protease AprX